MTVPKKVQDVLRAVAPTLASALAGPLAPVAAVVVTAALDAWLGPTEGGRAREPIEVAPADVVAAVQKNADDPRFILDLQKAQLDLQAYERRLPQTFAELEQKDRQQAREFSKDSGLSRPMFFFGMGFVGLALLALFGTVWLAVGALRGDVVIKPENAALAPVAFQLIGGVQTAFVGVMMLVLGFYYGSSAGSKEKTAQLDVAFRDLGVVLAEQAQAKPAAPVVVHPPAAPPVVIQAPAPEAEDAGPWLQGPYGGRRWRLAASGVVVEGDAAPMRTVGQPATVRRIWRDFGGLIERVCAEERVPLEILVATVATESAGRPQAALVEGDGRQSVGLTQTLVGTAREALGRPDLQAADLLDPETSLRAGARYIARQRPHTQFQPPLVAAAYNAGGLHPPREGDDNPWRLRSTGDHISRFCQFYGDCCAVAAEDGWGRADKAA